MADAEILNFLTIDVEDCFHVNYPGYDAAKSRRERTNVESLLDRLLTICASASIRCTFFVLGEMAERYPAAIRRIHAAGHEVAAHGYDHRPVRGMTDREFRDDVARTCRILEGLTGEPVLGYRAPSFSVGPESLPWFYDALAACGIRYSSSVFPGRTFLYGIPGFSAEPVKRSSVIEFPITTFEVFGRRFPLYVRLLSAGALARKLRDANRQGRPGILYVHPREIDPLSPRLPLSRAQALIHYWGVRGCEAKLRRLMHEDLNFRAMREYAAP